jgi:hypothetical protein
MGLGARSIETGIDADRTLIPANLDEVVKAGIVDKKGVDSPARNVGVVD